MWQWQCRGRRCDPNCCSVSEKCRHRHEPEDGEVVDYTPGAGGRHRGGDLVETFLENFVQVHRVLLSGDGVHLLVTDLCSESLARLAGWSPLDMENTGNFHSSKLY